MDRYADKKLDSSKLAPEHSDCSAVLADFLIAEATMLGAVAIGVAMPLALKPKILSALAAPAKQELTAIPVLQSTSKLEAFVYSVFKSKTANETAVQHVASELPLSKIYKSNLPSLVKVLDVDSYGTGFVVSKDGLIATARHCVAGNPTAVDIVTHNGQRLKACVISENIGEDLALLKIRQPCRKNKLAPVLLKETAHESKVAALGYPRNSEQLVASTGKLTQQVQRKQLDARNSAGKNPEQILLKTTCPLRGGNSGGPLVDLQDGQVIGVNLMGVTPESALSSRKLYCDEALSATTSSLRRLINQARHDELVWFKDIEPKHLQNLQKHISRGPRVSSKEFTATQEHIVNVAQNTENKHDYVKAELLYKLVINPNQLRGSYLTELEAKSLAGLAECAYKQERYLKALNLYSDLALLDSPPPIAGPKLLEKIGHCYFNTGRNQQGAEHFEVANWLRRQAKGARA